MILELLFAERNHICSVCVANGSCVNCVLSCDVGFDDCNGEDFDGCEAETGNDASRCGDFADGT